MQIEEGKFYKTRDGRKVGPMKPSGVDAWPWIVNVGDGKCWWDDGSKIKYTDSPDLIAEWTDEPETSHYCHMLSDLQDVAAKHGYTISNVTTNEGPVMVDFKEVKP